MLVLVVCAGLVARVLAVLGGAEDHEGVAVLDRLEHRRVDVAAALHVDDLEAHAHRRQRRAELLRLERHHAIEA